MFMKKGIFGIVSVITVVVIVCVICFTVGDKANEYISRLNDRGFEVEKIAITDEMKDMGIKWAVSATGLLSGIQHVDVYAFAKEKDAKAFYDMMRTQHSTRNLHIDGDVVLHGSEYGLMAAKK